MPQRRREREQIAQTVGWKTGLEALHARIGPTVSASGTTTCSSNP